LIWFWLGGQGFEKVLFENPFISLYTFSIFYPLPFPFLRYDFFKDGLLSSGYFQDGTPLHVAASALAGTVATTVCSPADVIKARVMNANGTQGNLIAKLTKTLKKEGLGFLFRGWTPAWIRLSPNVSCLKDSKTQREREYR